MTSHTEIFFKAIPVTASTDEAKRKATYEAVKNNIETDSVHKKVYFNFKIFLSNFISSLENYTLKSPTPSHVLTLFKTIYYKLVVASPLVYGRGMSGK